MAAPIYNPRMPYCELIPGGPLTPGRMVRIQGCPHPNASRFAINLQVGPNVNPRDDIVMHLNPRFDENRIVRNSLIYQNWGDEESHPNFMPLQRGVNFELLILCEQAEYKIAVNGQHFCEFRHRMPPQSASCLALDGDFNVTLLAFEGGAPAGGYMPTPAPGPAPTPGYGAPQPQPSPYGAPPGGYGAPAAAPYGAAPSPYGAPPGGYGPPPPPYGAPGTGPYPPHGGGSGGGGLLNRATGAAAGVLGGLGLGKAASMLPGVKPSGGYPSAGYPSAGYPSAGYPAAAAAAAGAAGYAAYGPQTHHKKGKKSKLAKYGVPLAAGLGGAYALNKVSHGFGHGFHHSSSSSSSSSEEE